MRPTRTARSRRARPKDRRSSSSNTWHLFFCLSPVSIDLAEVRGARVRKSVLLGALGLLAGGTPVVAVTVPARIPVAKFAALPAMHRPILSPDGHRIAASSVADGKTTLMLLSAD